MKKGWDQPCSKGSASEGAAISCLLPQLLGLCKFRLPIPSLSLMPAMVVDAGHGPQASVSSAAFLRSSAAADLVLFTLLRIYVCVATSHVSVTEERKRKKKKNKKKKKKKKTLVFRDSGCVG